MDKKIRKFILRKIVLKHLYCSVLSGPVIYIVATSRESLEFSWNFNYTIKIGTFG